MKECPNCGYIDPPHWRPRIFDFEVDFCHLSDLEMIDADLAQILKRTKSGKTVEQGVYCYKRTGTNYIWRLWLPLFKVRGWAPKRYYDSAGSKKSADHKRGVHWVNIKKIVREKDRHTRQAKL